MFKNDLETVVLASAPESDKSVQYELASKGSAFLQASTCQGTEDDLAERAKLMAIVYQLPELNCDVHDAVQKGLFTDEDAFSDTSSKDSESRAKAQT